MCLSIERGKGNLYYGIRMMDKLDLEIKINNEPRFDEIRQFLKKQFSDSQTNHNSHWVVYKFLEPAINFQSFSDSNTLRLANQQHRKEYIAKIWEEIQEFIRLCQDELKKIEN